MRRTTLRALGFFALAFAGGFVGSCADRHLAAAARRSLEEDRERGRTLLRDLDRTAVRIVLVGQVVARAEGFLAGRELAGREAVQILARGRR